MDIQLTTQRLFVLDERLQFEEIQRRAIEKRTSAFGSGIGGLLQRPKPDDVTLVASQRRVEPLWHVVGRARYVYDRTRSYAVPASAGDVRSVTIQGRDLPVVASSKGGPAFALEVLEHCRDEFVEELLVDGLTGSVVTDAPALVTGPRTEVADPAVIGADETVVVSPEHRASSVVRQLLASMLRPLQADVVSEEALTIEHLDLCYRPVWAFEFRWAAKDRQGVVEIDALTGQARQATTLRTQLTRTISREALFDIGADTVGLLVPGGSIAVKVARAAIDRSY